MSEFADPAAGDEVPDDVAAMFDLSMKKKKKTTKKKDKVAVADTDGAPQEEGAIITIEGASSSGAYEFDPPIYTYEQLLNRVVDFVHQNNPELTDKKRFTMKPPQLMRGLFLPFFC
jgi:translation initiation factor 2 subunit 2